MGLLILLEAFLKLLGLLLRLITLVAIVSAWRLPKTLRAKIICTGLTVVLAVGFWYGPALYKHWQERQRHARQAEIVQHCADRHVRPLTTPVDSLHIAGSAITQPVTLRSAVAFLLAHGLSTLEIDVPRQDGRTFHVDSGDATLAVPQGQGATQVLWLALAPRGDPGCRHFDKWLRESPGNRLGPLRELGLRPDQCIVATLLEAPQSPVSLQAVMSPLTRTNAQRRLQGPVDADYRFTVTERESGRLLASARTVLAWHDEADPPQSLCGDDTAAQAPGHSHRRPGKQQSTSLTLPGLLPVRLLGAPTLSIDDQPADFPEQGTARAADLQVTLAMRGRPQEVRSPLVDGPGRRWIERLWIQDSDVPGREASDYLAMLDESRLHKTQVRVPGGRFGLVYALLASEDEVRLIAKDVMARRHWLLVYNASGQPRRALAMDEAAQVQLLHELRE